MLKQQSVGQESSASTEHRTDVVRDTNETDGSKLIANNEGKAEADAKFQKDVELKATTWDELESREDSVRLFNHLGPLDELTTPYAIAGA